MLFYLGALRRLNEFGLLRVVERILSVSGGPSSLLHWQLRGGGGETCQASLGNA